MAERHIACRVVSGMKKSELRSLEVDAGLDKLQVFLLDMVPGDEVSVPRAMDISGLDAPKCEAVLEALARAGLMIRLQHSAYVRRRLESAEQRLS